MAPNRDQSLHWIFWVDGPAGREGGGGGKLEFSLIGKDSILGGTCWILAAYGIKRPIVRPAKGLLILIVANGFRCWYLTLVWPVCRSIRSQLKNTINWLLRPGRGMENIYHKLGMGAVVRW